MSQETSHPSISLSQLLSESGVQPGSVIRVTGPGSLPALLWLCRRGYEKVGCLQAGQRAPADDAQALLVAHTATANWLSDLLDRGPHVREGGVMIVQTAHAPAANDGVVEAVFRGHGFNVVRRLSGAHREVLVARRRPSELRAAA